MTVRLSARSTREQERHDHDHHPTRSRGDRRQEPRRRPTYHRSRPVRRGARELPEVKLAAALTVIVLAAAGCSDSGAERGAGTTTARPPSPTTTLGLTPGYHYTDCGKIRAGDPLDDSLDILCDPANAAEIFTLDCAAGIYVLLDRPEGDLEGFLEGDLSGHSAPTTWRTAGEADETAKTPFAQQVCEEH